MLSIFRLSKLSEKQLIVGEILIIFTITNPNMSKGLFLLFAGTLLCAVAYSQFEYYTPKDTIRENTEYPGRHQYGDMQLSLSPNIIVNPESGVRAAGGINFQIFLGRNFSLDADLLIGKNYIHGGPGVIAIPFWLFFFSASEPFLEDAGSIENLFIMVAVGILSLEHTSYHIRLSDDLEISPYISLLRYRIDLRKTENHTQNGQFVFATGIHIDKYIGRFYISPYAEYNIGYRDKLSGFNTGVGIGISFAGK
jgi:hypothetical protein